LKQRWPSRDGRVTPVTPRIHRPHGVLDYHSSKHKDWNQDEANDSKAMMIYQMGSEQQKQKASRRHQEDSGSKPSSLWAIAHKSYATSSHRPPPPTPIPRTPRDRSNI
jgi:hypothetical protein